MGLGQGDRGYAMAALLVGLSIMGVLLSAALPVWSHYSRREKEEELIWRGSQYARAIGLFQRKYANTFPPNVDVLVEQKFLRKKYKDPITGEDFQSIPATGMPGGGMVIPGGQQGGGALIQPGAAAPKPAGPPTKMTSVGTTVQAGIGIQGVVSKSDKTSIKIYNGRTRYNEWAFVYMASSQFVNPGTGGGPGNPPNSPPGGGFGNLPNMPNVPNVPPGAKPFGPPSSFGPPSPFGQPPMEPSGPGQMISPGGFAPLGGTSRRPGMGLPAGGMQPGARPGQQQFGPASPFGQPPQQPPQRPPARPPGG